MPIILYSPSLTTPWDTTGEGERVIRGRSFTLRKTFQVDGLPADPTGTPGVTITRISDGTAVTMGAVTNETEAGTWSVTVPASANATLDALAVGWTGVVNGETQEYLDYVGVAGAAFFTLAEARAFGIAAASTDAEVIAMRTTVEQELEQACACAFVPRWAREVRNGDGGLTIMLRPNIRVIRSATVGGTSLTASDLAFQPTGAVYNPSGWTSGYSNVVIDYEHGPPVIPHGGNRVALILAKAWLVGQRSPIDDRAITFSTNDAGSYSLAVPGRNGSHFGIPDVDAWVDRNSLVVGIA